MTKNIREKTETYLRQQDMIPSGGHVIVGVSGGADSVCLLFLLYDLKEKMNFTLEAVHVDHQIRGEEALEDAAFVQALCSRLQVPCTLVSEDVPALASKEKLTLEEAGRKVRYRAFREAAEHFTGEGKTVVAVAHHKNDNVETVLLNLARGSALRGLGGILPVSERDGLTIIRPLLCLERTEIEEYLQERRETWRTDATNARVEYTRNRVRLEIIPAMEKLNGRAVEHIAENAEYLSRVERFLEQQTDALYEDFVKRDGQERRLCIGGLLEADALLRERVVYRALCECLGSRKDVTGAQVREVEQLLFLQTGSRISLPAGREACRIYEELLLRPVETKQRPDPVRIDKDALLQGPVTVSCGDHCRICLELIDVNEENRKYLIEKNQCKKVFDYDKIKNGFFFGYREEGDRIRLYAGSKSVNRYFIDEKIPQNRRDDCLLMKDGSEVVWILGMRISEAYKITDSTKRGVAVEVTGGFS